MAGKSQQPKTSEAVGAIKMEMVGRNSPQQRESNSYTSLCQRSSPKQLVIARINHQPQPTKISHPGITVEVVTLAQEGIKC